MTTLPAASGCSSASRDQWNTCRTSVPQLLLNVSHVWWCSGRDSGAAPAASTSTRGWWASMSRPATTGSAASAATGVKRSPSCACNSASVARSRATPTTFAPAPASAMAMPRPKPRLAPVTSAVAPDSSCAGIRNSLILRSERVSPPLPVLIRAVAGTHRRPGAVNSGGPADLYRCGPRPPAREKGRGDAGQRGVRAAYRAVPARTARALLPDARLGLRRRGPGAGDPGAGLAVVQRLPGQVVAADLAACDRYERLPAGDREPGPPAAALGPGRAGRRPGRPAGPGAAGDPVAAADPGRAGVPRARRPGRGRGD